MIGFKLKRPRRHHKREGALHHIAESVIQTPPSHNHLHSSPPREAEQELIRDLPSTPPASPKKSFEVRNVDNQDKPGEYR